jgi:hypothetical protein
MELECTGPSSDRVASIGCRVLHGVVGLPRRANNPSTHGYLRWLSNERAREHLRDTLPKYEHWCEHHMDHSF